MSTNYYRRKAAHAVFIRAKVSFSWSGVENATTITPNGSFSNTRPRDLPLPTAKTLVNVAETMWNTYSLNLSAGFKGKKLPASRS